jgi:hypothetical protein
MHRISAGVAACLAAAVVAGCGSATASHPASAASTSATGTARQGSGTATAGSGTATAGAGTPASCQGRSPVAGTVTVTLADNQKTYCQRVGDKLRVYLRGTDSSRWLRPVASSSSLEPSPDPAAMLARGVTGGSFAAVRPGKVLVTSVRPPCRVPTSKDMHELEPADPLPRIYPIQYCASAHRFSVWITVLRSA